MTSQTIDRAERRQFMLLGTGWLLAVMIVAVIARRATTGDPALVVAAIYGLGTLVMAVLTARATVFPRWAWFTTAGLLSLALMLGAIGARDPRELKDLTSSAWMMPWMLLLMGLTPSPTSGWCATHTTRAGWLLVGFGFLFTVILLGLPLLVRRF